MRKNFGSWAIACFFGFIGVCYGSGSKEFNRVLKDLRNFGNFTTTVSFDGSTADLKQKIRQNFMKGKNRQIKFEFEESDVFLSNNKKTERKSWCLLNMDKVDTIAVKLNSGAAYFCEIAFSKPVTYHHEAGIEQDVAQSASEFVASSGLVDITFSSKGDVIKFANDLLNLANQQGSQVDEVRGVDDLGDLTAKVDVELDHQTSD